MPNRLLIVHAHPDAGHGHFGDALAQHYAESAESAGHEVEWLVPSEQSFPLLKDARQWREERPGSDILAAQRALRHAEHVVFFYPLWMGDMPALLKAWLEQVMRPGFAFGEAEGKFPDRALRGRSARLVVTMGMPALFYRVFYRAHSVHSFRRNILRFAGFKPVRLSLVGRVDGPDRHRRNWLARMQKLGAAGQ
ncbi:MAG: NAD(P)H-dependent oxidoreductase [Candidatus Wenzhouxiangella sp. M2_3B_020]